MRPPVAVENYQTAAGFDQAAANQIEPTEIDKNFLLILVAMILFGAVIAMFLTINMNGRNLGSVSQTQAMVEPATTSTDGNPPIKKPAPPVDINSVALPSFNADITDQAVTVMLDKTTEFVFSL